MTSLTQRPVHSTLILASLLLAQSLPTVASVPTLSFKNDEPLASPSRTTTDRFPSLRSMTKPGTTLNRILNGGSGDDYESLLVDSDGNEYEPYSLAWRYLGIYMDCDVDDLYSGGGGGGGGGGYYTYDDDGYDDDVDVEDMMDWYRHRNLQDKKTNSKRRLSGSGDGDDCTRKVLWAAYHDPRYKGLQIGEYQYYNFTDGTYSKDFCANTNPITGRCVRMDCHERSTHMKLVGVYKEADGLVDWAEQLFKHHGYCLWGEDDYEFMEQYREFWPNYCRKLYYSGEDGSTLYMDLQPTAGGNISVGIYTDELCVTPSYYTFADYIMLYYSYYGYYDKGAEVAETWAWAIEQWNLYMNVYKICQPCRTYNLNMYMNNGESGSGSGSGDNRMRFLGEDNDGEGEEEINGYNCYDNAGYTNCNQCYKFEVKTDMEQASLEDLSRADKQGTILAIKVKGRWYGQGGFSGPPKVPVMGILTVAFFAATAAAFVLSIVYILRVTPLLRNLRDYFGDNTRGIRTFFYWIKGKWSNWGRKDYELEDKPAGDGLYTPPSTQVDSNVPGFIDESISSFHTANSKEGQKNDPLHPIERAAAAVEVILPPVLTGETDSSSDPSVVEDVVPDRFCAMDLRAMVQKDQRKMDQKDFEDAIPDKFSAMDVEEMMQKDLEAMTHDDASESDNSSRDGNSDCEQTNNCQPEKNDASKNASSESPGSHIDAVAQNEATSASLSTDDEGGDSSVGTSNLAGNGDANKSIVINPSLSYNSSVGNSSLPGNGDSNNPIGVNPSLSYNSSNNNECDSIESTRSNIVTPVNNNEEFLVEHDDEAKSESSSEMETENDGARDDTSADGSFVSAKSGDDQDETTSAGSGRHAFV